MAVLLDARQYDRIVAEARETQKEFPGYLYALRMEVTALRALGRGDEARNLAARQTREQPDHGAPVNRAYLLAVTGESAKVDALLAGDGERFSSYDRAVTFAAAGDEEQALRWFRKAVEEGWKPPPGVDPHPDLQRLLAADTDYVALVRSARTAPG